MTSLFSAIDEAAACDTLLVASDFDGTLARLCDAPGAAVLHPRAALAIRRLCDCANTHLLIVSGRRRADLKHRFSDFPEAELVGSHGNESGDAAPTAVGSTRYEGLASVLNGIAAHADGAWIEPKPVSLALHFRAVAFEQRTQLLQMLSVFIPPSAADRVLVGRDTVEYLFARADKGSAIREAIERRAPDRACFLGDDATDEAAFAALRERDVGIKIGSESSIARFRIATFEDGLDVLERLAEQRHARSQ